MSQQCVSEHSCPAPSPHRARSHPCTRAREREPSPAPFLGPGRYEPGEGATQQSGGSRHWWAPLRSPREEKPPAPGPGAEGPRMGAWSLALPFPPLKKVIFPVLPLGEVAGILPSSRNFHLSHSCHQPPREARLILGARHHVQLPPPLRLREPFLAAVTEPLSGRPCSGASQGSFQCTLPHVQPDSAISFSFWDFFSLFFLTFLRTFPESSRLDSKACEVRSSSQHSPVAWARAHWAALPFAFLVCGSCDFTSSLWSTRALDPL